MWIFNSLLIIRKRLDGMMALLQWDMGKNRGALFFSLYIQCSVYIGSFSGAIPWHKYPRRLIGIFVIALVAVVCANLRTM